MILGYPLSIIIRYNFIFPLDTASAIIKALYALTILPDFEIFWKSIAFEASPSTTTFDLVVSPEFNNIAFTWEADNFG